MSDKHKFILDTNVFDYIYDKKIELLNLLAVGEYYTTNIQLSEIKNIPNPERRRGLLALYQELPQSKILLESGVWIDDLQWDDEQPWRDDIGDVVNRLNGNTEGKPWKDSLIGEITKLNNLILVTNDKSLLVRLNSQKINCKSQEEFDQLVEKGVL